MKTKLIGSFLFLLIANFAQALLPIHVRFIDTSGRIRREFDLSTTQAHSIEDWGADKALRLKVDGRMNDFYIVARFGNLKVLENIKAGVENNSITSMDIKAFDVHLNAFGSQNGWVELFAYHGQDLPPSIAYKLSNDRTYVCSYETTAKLNELASLPRLDDENKSMIAITK